MRIASEDGYDMDVTSKGGFLSDGHCQLYEAEDLKILVPSIGRQHADEKEERK